MSYCKRFSQIVSEVHCLACEFCLPPAERTEGKFCNQEIPKPKETNEAKGKITFRQKYGIADDNPVMEYHQNQEVFNLACERYRELMQELDGKSYQERRDAINKLRAGRI